MLSHSYDIICLGGGLAGVSFAITCAKNNKKVLIVEKNEYLGGSTLSEFCLKGIMTKNNELIHSTCCEEYLKELDKRNSIYYVDGSPGFYSINSEELKIILLKKCEEYGVDILFHSQPIDINLKNDRIVSTTLWGKGKSITVISDYFVDCTGIGSYLSLVGIPYSINKGADIDYCISVCNYSNYDLKLLSDYSSVEEVFPSPEKNRIYVRFSPIYIDKIDSYSIYNASVHFSNVTYEFIRYMRNNYSMYKDMKLSSVPQTLSINNLSRFEFKDDKQLLTDTLDIDGNTHSVYIGELCHKKYSNLIICGKSLGPICNNAGAAILISESAGLKMIK